MTTRKIPMILMFLIALSLLISGCGKEKTTVKYIVPTGYTIMEVKANDATPVQMEIKEEKPANNESTGSSHEETPVISQNTTAITPQQNTTKAIVNGSGKFIDYVTVVEAANPVKGTYTPSESSIKESGLQAKLCSINEVILGYVGCYYGANKTQAKVTLKDTGRGDVEQIWFYLVFPDKTIYMKSEGFTVGNINDYNLLLSEWSAKYSGKMQRILITPVVKEGDSMYVCNNRQLLLIPENSCRETVD